MSKELVNVKTEIISNDTAIDNLNNISLGSIVNNPNLTIHGKNGSLTISNKSTKQTFTVIKKEGFEERRASQIDKDMSKEERNNLIVDLKKDGRKQQEIADIVITSQATVSRVLKKRKKK